MTPYFQDNTSGAGHGRRALRSGAVSIVARSINALIQIGSVLCLARLLSPEDYGLVGMVTAVTGFAPVLVDLGSRDAIVQRPSITEGEVSALFWITQGVGFASALAVACSGPLIARFYGDPRLTLIAIVSSLTFITSAVTAQHYALLRRAMMFTELGIIEVIANLLGAILAIGIALNGFHYWALVIRPIAASAFLAAGVWIGCRWLPARPAVTGRVKEMVRFGLNVTGFTMTDFVGRSGDRVAIGYRLGAATLGYYQNSLFVYENLIDIVISPLHGVAVSGLSKLRHAPAELRASWTKALSTLTFFAMPAFGLLAVTSRELIVVLLGAKWAHSGILLSILAIRGIPHTVERTAGWLHVTAGRTERWVRWGTCVACTQIVALFCGLPYGPTGIVTAYVVAMFILCVPSITYAGRPLGITTTDLLKAIWRQMAGALISTAACFTLRRFALADLPLLASIATLATAYIAIYLILVVGVFRLRSPLRTAVSLGGDRLSARLGRSPAAALLDVRG